MSALADLVKPINDEDAERLEEDETEILREAGILPEALSSKRRKQAKTKAKHIVFAESEEEGAPCKLFLRLCTVLIHAHSARRHAAASHRTAQEDVEMEVDEEKEVDMGWKTVEAPKKRKGKKKADDAEGVVELNREEASVSEAGNAALLRSHQPLTATSDASAQGAVGALGP